MNLSWNSQSSPGFIYFDSPAENSEFIPFDSTSTPKPKGKIKNSPFNRGLRKQRFFGYNDSNNSTGNNSRNSHNFSGTNSNTDNSDRSWRSNSWKSNENDSYRTLYNRKSFSGDHRSFSTSRGNQSRSFGSFKMGNTQREDHDIKMYIHPSFLENPWEELEKNLKESGNESGNSESSSSR